MLHNADLAVLFAQPGCSLRAADSDVN